MRDLRADGYVSKAAAGCRANQCQAEEAQGILHRARQALADRERIMQIIEQYEGTLALWCSRGGHAFSELDPGRVIIPVASARDAAGAEIRIPAQAICGEHAKNLTRNLTRPAELSNGDMHD